MTTAQALRTRVYCTRWCAADFPVSPNEDRDALWTELSRLGRTDHGIASMYGVSRARVQQVAAARM